VRKNGYYSRLLQGIDKHDVIFFMSVLMPTLHAHVACPCFMSMLHVRAPCALCPCCPCSMSITLLHVHAACPCPYAACLLYAACPCYTSTLLAHTACLCCMSICMSLSHVYAAYSCFMSLLHAHASSPHLPTACAC
jgi:hypothetical protein